MNHNTDTSPRRIVITGPESTGKSSLAAALAQAYDCAWVPEYAREYLERKGADYVYDDLLQIAKGQIKLEDQIAASHSGPLLFCDTDLYVLKVWSEHKYGTCHEFILQNIAQRHYDAYILCDIDLPWVFDPLREHPEPQMRKYFYHVYLDLLIHSSKPFLAVTGTLQERIAQVQESALLKNSF